MFQIGDRVRVKGITAPYMIVVGHPQAPIRAPLEVAQSYYICVWFDTRNRLQTNTFHQAVLYAI